MKTKSVLLCIAFFITMNLLFAVPASKARLSGTIHDKATGEALEFTFVMLVNSSQKLIVAATTDDQGKFTLKDVAAGSYILKISSMGYIMQLIPIAIVEGQTEVKIPLIEMAPDSKKLEAVTVSATKNLIEQDIDKTIINVADFISTEGSNASDILRKIPGITVDNDGNVSLNGQPAAVWIDNRPSNLSGHDLLNMLYFLDGADIDKIEIIQNPSAKYDAAGGGGIINILTKGRVLRGLSGSVQAGGGYYLEPGDAYNLNGGLTLNYSNKWLSSVLNANARKSQTLSNSESTINYGDLFQRTYNASKNTNTSQSVRMTNTFFVDKKNNIGLMLSGMWNESNGGTNGNSGSEIYYGGQLTDSSTNKSTNNRKVANYSANASYQHIFKENAHDILVNFDYMNYTVTPHMQQENYFYGATVKPDLIFATNSNQQVEIASAKLDYVRPLWKKVKLEAGGKWSQATTDNTMVRNDLLNDVWQFNDTLSNTYRYKERIGALYTSVGAQFGKKWNAKAGLRWENTWNQGDWQVGKKDTTTYQGYNNFFSTLFVNYIHSMEHSFSLSYAMRIQRPNYNALNPFREYSGAYVYSQGNPDLLPQYTHTFNLGYTYKKITVSLFTQYATQVIVQESSIDTTFAKYPVTAVNWGNFGSTNFSGISASWSNVFPTLWWSFNLYLSGFYTKSVAPDYSNIGWYGSAYMENTFYIGRTWRAELTGNAQSPMAYGYYTISGRYSISTGVRKNLWNHKASVSLYVDDIFDSQNNHVKSNRDGQKIEMNNTWSSRQVRLSFSYYFRQMKGKTRKATEMDEGGRL